MLNPGFPHSGMGRMDCSRLTGTGVARTTYFRGMPKSKRVVCDRGGSRGGFVTIHDYMLSDPKLEGFSWTLKNNGAHVVADIYYLLTNESLPALVIVDSKLDNVLVGTLKQLGIFAVAFSGRGKKNLTQSADITVTTGDRISDLMRLNHCSRMKTIIHTTGIIHERITSCAEFRHAKRIFCTDTAATLQSVRHRYSPPTPAAITVSDAKARALVAYKLSVCMKTTGSGAESGQMGELASQIAALKNKLAVLMATTQVPVKASSSNAVLAASSTEGESKRVRRLKMQVLGMLTEAGGCFAGSGGRALAATRWMDCTTGSELGAPWPGEIRMGASADTASFALRSCVQAGRALVEHFMTAKKRPPNISERRGKKRRLDCGTASEAVDQSIVPPPAQGMPQWMAEEEWTCLPHSVREKVKDCIVTAIGWRPNPHCKDDDEWGGVYGKCCAHNEVVMHYLRPFSPLEVLNTLVCSCTKPAPGNLFSERTNAGRPDTGRVGFDGCLEFLQMQCRFHSRCLTVWDTQSIHFITVEGKHTAYPKAALLRFSKISLDVLISNLRRITIDTNGRADPAVLVRSLLYHMRIGIGVAYVSSKLKVNITSRKGSSTIQNIIGSYLLCGRKEEWQLACTEIDAETVWLN